MDSQSQVILTAERSVACKQARKCPMRLHFDQRCLMLKELSENNIPIEWLAEPFRNNLDRHALPNTPRFNAGS
jgi:hypothetical protein